MAKVASQTTIPREQDPYSLRSTKSGLRFWIAWRVPWTCRKVVRWSRPFFIGFCTTRLKFPRWESAFPSGSALGYCITWMNFNVQMTTQMRFIPHVHSLTSEKFVDIKIGIMKWLSIIRSRWQAPNYAEIASLGPDDDNNSHYEKRNETE